MVPLIRLSQQDENKMGQENAQMHRKSHDPVPHVQETLIP